MAAQSHSGTLLEIPLIKEKYTPSFLLAAVIHVAVVVFFLIVPYLLPRTKPIELGSGPGGGGGGQTYTVGVAEDMSGGIGMVKPSPVPQPPPLPAEKTPREEVKEKAIELPDITPEKKKTPKITEAPKVVSKQKTVPAPQANVIPTAPQPGSGGVGRTATGSGGGLGGGVGISVGSGSGGVGDLWYARMVEQRIGSNWIKPSASMGRVEIVYSFVITNEGQIREIRQEKSSGNEALDLTAERAIRASTPLPRLPRELQGRPVQFTAQFIHPPNP